VRRSEKPNIMVTLPRLKPLLKASIRAAMKSLLTPIINRPAPPQVAGSIHRCTVCTTAPAVIGLHTQAVMERRAPSTRRRNTRSGRRSTDPRPLPLDAIDDGQPKQTLRALTSRVEAIEQILQTQFQRIAQLQVVLDRFMTPLGRRIVKSGGLEKSKRS